MIPTPSDRALALALAMRIVLGCLVAVALGASALAQNDVIRWNDGKVTSGVTVTAFNLREVTYTSRGTKESRPSDRVASLEVAKIRDKYKRAYGAPKAERAATFHDIAEANKNDPFVAQFGYYEAAQLALAAGDYPWGFQILEELEANCPDSGFKSLRYTAKLDYYLALDKKADFASLAAKYESATQVEGYPEGAVVEASYYKVMARAMKGELDNAKLRAEMTEVARRADPNYPATAARARVTIANTLRLEGKPEEAKKEFEEIVDDGATAPSILPSAWLGLAHVHSAMGTPANKEPYRDALLAYLRVYLDDNAPDDLKAEALYYGAQAAGRWGGESSAFYRRVLRGRLLNHFSDSPWAKK